VSAFLVEIDPAIMPGGSTPEEWLRASAALRYRGPDALETVVMPGARFTVATRRISRREARLTQPVVERDAGILVAFDGRLDAPGHLAARLGLRGEQATRSDPELVALAYARLGSGFLSAVHGEFSLVVYDCRSRQLLGARDTFGTRILYWARTRRGFALSNELPALRAVGIVEPGLDPEAIADFLLHGYVDFFDKTLTPFRGVRAVAPSGSVTVVDGKIIASRFRTFSELLQPQPRLNPKDVPAAFNDVFATAVAERLDANRVLIPLSGGLDSGTIAATAKDCVERGAGRASLQTLTAVSDERDPEFAYAKATASALRIAHDVRFLDSSKLLAEAAPSWYPTVDFFPGHLDESERADIAGVDITMFGAAGDSLFHPEHSSWLQLIARHGQASTLHAWRTLRKQGRSLAIGTGLGSIGRRRSQGPSFELNMPHGMPCWLQRDFTTELHLDERWANNLNWHSVDPLHESYPNAQHWLQWSNWFCGFHTVGIDYTPTEWTDPFLDFRVISFVFGLPPEPWSFRKHLLRMAGSGRLPPEVLARRKTPAGNYVAPFMTAVDHDRVNGWTLASHLGAFIDRSKVPPIKIDEEGRNGYLNLRPLMLQRWFDGLPAWPN
jgi:hypothetical protein